MLWPWTVHHLECVRQGEVLVFQVSPSLPIGTSTMEDATLLTRDVDLLEHPDVDSDPRNWFVELRCAVLGKDCTYNVVVSPFHRFWGQYIRHELTKDLFRSQ